MPLPALVDEEYLMLSRVHINEFLRTHLDALAPEAKVLEIGPKLAWPGWHTLDINEARGAHYTADICKPTPISNNTYDLVICISVLEHVLDPWAAMREIRRITKPGGLLLAQAPLNFRVHGPLPDLWRFTLHGWAVLLKDWDDVRIDPCETPQRPLMPVAYTASARCDKDKNADAEKIEWRWIA